MGWNLDVTTDTVSLDDDASAPVGDGTAIVGGASLHPIETSLLTRRSPGGSSVGASLARAGSADGGETLLSERDLRQIERDHPDGLSSVQIIDIFAKRGVRFSEATFRKYVQQRMLPRSRRVGRKGKHQGSLGVYPCAAVRRINVIKRLMERGYTIEDIQRQFLRFRDDVEAVGTGLEAVFAGFEDALKAPQFDTQERKDLKKELVEARRSADELTRRLELMEKRLTDHAERPSGKPAPGGAEDLL